MTPSMQLCPMLRAEGVKGNGNQTAWESHSNVCTAFLNITQTSSLSIFPDTEITSSVGRVYPGLRTSDTEGFSDVG